MKRKTLTLVLCLLATFALASIGFASWVLTNPDVTVTGTTQGDFTVYDATDKSVSVSASFSNTGFVFGAPVTPETGGTPWLTTESMSPDVLKITVTLTVTNYSSLSDSGLTVKVYLYPNPTLEKTGLQTAIEKNYISCKTGTFSTQDIKIGSDTKSAYVLSINIPKSKIKQIEDSVVGTATFDLEFEWGTLFEKTNPFNYYYNKPFDASVATTLNALYTALNELNFNLLITD